MQAFRAESKRFDLVLTDETMPDLTGTELARECRLIDALTPFTLHAGSLPPRTAIAHYN